ncbi:MAG: hypothetical protein ACTHMS_10100 [Jatrophihabitans sp.]|uniref:hypothetical protein n=1 Tax=Jatrophihabitans sp. TaxID=1932789 RepID=UPI003F801B86
MIVIVTDPGEPGGGGKSSGGGNAPDPCAQYPGYLHQQCVDNTGQQCLNLYAQYFGAIPIDALNALLVKNGCGALPPTVVPPDPATLAQRAADGFRLPSPSGARSPDNDLVYRGFGFTYVNLVTYFWTDPSTWRPLTATARAGAVWATVVATPVTLTVDPGDGEPAAVCGGPGMPWVEADGNTAVPGACTHIYRRMSGPAYDHPFTATQTISWRLTWTGSGNSSGTLTQRSTSTSSRLNVLQIQTVTCGSHGCGARS